MRHVRSVRGLAAGAALLMVAGCATDPRVAYFGKTESHANIYVAPNPPDIEKVAVLPFKAQTELIGSSVSDLFVTELLRADRYTLVERSQMANVLGESELALAGISEQKAVEVGNLLGADGVIVGTVDEYAMDAQRGRTYPAVGISVRLIECRTGKVIWSADLADRPEKTGMTLASQARKVVHEVTAGLYGHWRRQPKPRTASRPPAAAAPARIAAAPPSAAVPAGVAALVPAAPEAPKIPELAVSDLGLREVTLKWPPAAAGIRFRIERAESPGGPFAALETVDGPAGQYVDKGSAGRPLKDGTPYYYRIVPLAADGREGPPSLVRESMTAPPPEPPVGLRAETPHGRTVRLSWTASPSEGVARYRVERAPASAPDRFERAGEADGTSFTDGGNAGSTLADSASYLYRVAAVNRAGAVGPPSAPLTATTMPPPGAVTGLSAKAGLFRRVELSWSTSADPDVVRYEVSRSSPGENAFTPAATVEGRDATGHVDRGEGVATNEPGNLADGAEYAYRVVALTRFGSRSAPSDAVKARTKAPPPAPARLSATDRRPKAVGLSWPASAGEVARYEVEAAEAAGGPFAQLGSAPPAGKGADVAYVDSVGTDGRARWYRVRAVDGDGLASPWVGPAAGTSKPLPPAPARAEQAPGSGTVRLSWPAVPGDVVAYRVRKGDQKLVETEKPEASLGESDLRGGADLAIFSVDADGLESAPALAVHVPEPAPPVPAGLAASGDGLREVRLRWTAPRDNARTYRIERAPAAAGPFAPVATVDPAAAAFVDRGGPEPSLPDTAEFFYRLVALSAEAKESEPAPAVRGATAPPPAPPTELKAETQAARAVALAWTASAAEGVVRYLVERAEGDNANFARAGETPVSSFREGGTAESPLRDSTPYRYRVASVNRVGSTGPWTEPVGITTRPPPAAVAGLEARGDEVRCVPLSWRAAPEDDVVRYDLYRAESAEGPFEKLATIPGRATTAYLDGGRDPGTLPDLKPYWYRIRAVNAVTSESADAQAVTATTRAVPPVVTGIKTRSGTPREVAVAWDASPDAKVVGYDLLRQEAGAEPARIATITGRDQTTYNDRGDARRPTGLGALKDGTEYRYALVAFNTARASSAPSAVVPATTKPVPATPSNVTATTNLPKSVRIEWAASPDADIREYVVESATAPEGRFRELARIPPTPGARASCVDADEPDGAPRWYRLKAIDRDTLESAWSETAAGGTKPLPGAPTALTVAWGAGGAQVAWTPPPEPDIRGYRVWRKGLLGADLIAAVNTNATALDRTTVGKGLTVVVSAIDADNLEGPRSAGLEIRPPAEQAAGSVSKEGI